MKKKTKISLSVIAVLLLAGGILCYTRWHAWFGQPEEAPYSVSTTPCRVMLTFGNDGELSRMVSWQCDSILKDSYLELKEIEGDSVLQIQRISAIGEVFQSRAGKAAYYYAKLDELQPNALYQYKVVTGDKSSETYCFKTQDVSDNGKFSFLYVGDVQDTIGGVANELLKHAFALNRDAEFLLCGGDLVERPRDVDWQQAFDALDSIRQSVPIINITGNHDYLKELPARLERRFSLVFPYYLDSKIADNMVYNLCYGEAEIFCLDSFREFPYLWTQSRWLKQKLTNSDAKWKIVVMHHPVYSMRGKNNLTQKWAFHDLIEENGVDLVLQAHEHNYSRLTSPGNEHTIYTISHCSPKTYGHKDITRFEKFDTGRRYVQKIVISNDTLLMQTFALCPDSLVDEVVIVK